VEVEEVEMVVEVVTLE